MVAISNFTEPLRFSNDYEYGKTFEFHLYKLFYFNKAKSIFVIDF